MDGVGIVGCDGGGAEGGREPAVGDEGFGVREVGGGEVQGVRGDGDVGLKGLGVSFRVNVFFYFRKKKTRVLIERDGGGFFMKKEKGELTLGGSQRPQTVPPPGGAMRGIPPGVGLHIRIPSETTAFR